MLQSEHWERRGTGRSRRRVLRGLERDRQATRIVEVVAAARGVSREEIVCGRRCSNDVARARQLAMYLVHTLLGRTYREVGLLFGRDRTTVSHACARIEDRREDRSLFEREVAAIEARIAGVGHAAA